jgi:hypothetical protein
VKYYFSWTAFVHVGMRRFTHDLQKKELQNW